MKNDNSNNDKNKNSLMTNNNLNIKGNDNNKNKVVNKNKTTMNKNKAVDKSKNKNIINNKIIYRFSNPNKHDYLKKIERPGLQDIGEGNIITFEAIIIKEYNKFENCVTIMNLHKGKKYLADHTQLFLNEDLTDFNNRNVNESNLIRATARIGTYGKPNNKKYCLNLIPNKRILFLPHICYNNTEIKNEPTDIINKNLDNYFNKIDEARHDELLYMIETLRYRVNELTEGIYTEDFIYHYLINQYSLNTLNSDMYNNSIQTNEFTDMDLRNLILLLGGILYDIISNYQINIYDLFMNTIYRLNKTQGIYNLNCKNKKDCINNNNQFALFCENHNISFGKGWEIVRCRNKIFNINTKEYYLFDEISDGLMGIYYSTFK
jgi:hypothetical protein